MNLPHLHILLNHVPTVGFSVGVALFLAALVSRSDDLKRASLSIMFLIAVISTAVYCSGSAADVAICKGRQDCMSGVSGAAIAAHENAALLAYIVMQVVGGLAFVGLWQMQRKSRLGGGIAVATLALSALTFGMMARAATIGGEIRHPEILEEAAAQQTVAAATESPVPESPAPAEVPAGEKAGETKVGQKAEEKAAETPAAKPAAPAPAVARAYFEIEMLTPAAVRAFMGNNSWVWPACETLHFMGLSLLFSVVLIVDLRLLGVAKAMSYAAVHRMLPWAMLGFGINLLTGMMFFLAAPDQYNGNIVFFWKVVFILMAGVNALYFLVFDEAWKVGPGDDAPIGSKVAAASAIALWVGVLFCGHMLPFLGNAF